jgi:transcriptional regulator with XRE-family HTH domain
MVFFMVKGGMLMSLALGRAIRKARIDQDMRQCELCVAAGLSQKYVSDIERGKVDPRWSVVERLARALGVSLNQLGKDGNEAVVPEHY